MTADFTASKAASAVTPTVDGLRLVDRAAMAATLDQRERQTPRLAPAELARAEAMSSGDDARLWRAGRIALRHILERAAQQLFGTAGAKRLRCRPFTLTAHGEPYWPDVPFVFSQSDAGPYLLIGVSSHGRIGVDIEQPRPFAMSPARQARVITAARQLALVGRVEGFSPETRQTPAIGAVGSREKLYPTYGISADQPSEPTDAPLSLLQAWTRIEAFAKARGPSLARVLTELGLIGVGDRAAKPDCSKVIIDSGLYVSDLALPFNLTGAVAWPTGRPVPPLRLFQPTSGALEIDDGAGVGEAWQRQVDK